MTEGGIEVQRYDTYEAAEKKIVKYLGNGSGAYWIRKIYTNKE